MVEPIFVRIKCFIVLLFVIDRNYKQTSLKLTFEMLLNETTFFSFSAELKTFFRLLQNIYDLWWQ